MSNTITTATDTNSIAPGGSVSPNNAKRNPSTTPAIGFSPYSARQRSGTIELGYATGVANSQNWIRKLIVYRTSRYCTFSADSQRPTPNAVETASRINAGSVRMAQLGTIR